MADRDPFRIKAQSLIFRIGTKLPYCLSNPATDGCPAAVWNVVTENLRRRERPMP
jgi:hypothetical protein